MPRFLLFRTGEKMSNTNRAQQAPDYERWMRELITGIKSVRRWKSKNIFSNYGFFGNKLNWLRAYLLLPFFNFFAGLINRFVRAIDPWNATPENVLEHSFKQAMIIQKMLAIEIYRGNPHKLDYYLLLQYAINHDLAESVVGDIIFQEKAKNKEFYDREENIAYLELISRGVKEDYAIYFSFPQHLELPKSAMEMEFWDLSERIGYCYFMLEEICAGKLTLGEKLKFFQGVTKEHFSLLREYENKFVSVKEILLNELYPKAELAFARITLEVFLAR